MRNDMKGARVFWFYAILMFIIVASVKLSSTIVHRTFDNLGKRPNPPTELHFTESK